MVWLEGGLVNDVFAVDLCRWNPSMSADIIREELSGLVVAEKLFLVVTFQDKQSFVHVAQSGSVFAETRLQSIVEGPERIDEVSTRAAQDKEKDACQNWK